MPTRPSDPTQPTQPAPSGNEASPPVTQALDAAHGYSLHAEQSEPLEHAARLLHEAAETLFGEREQIRLAIPGGSAMAAAIRLADLLGPQWSRMALTWVDERCVAPTDSDSNQGAAFAAGLKPTETLLPLFMQDESPEDAVRRVDEVLRRDFAGGLDLVLLGMGEDGHIASLFPSPNQGMSAAAPSSWVAHIKNSPKPPSNRITLTRPLLKTARHIVLVAVGESKRNALERLLAGDPSLPASDLPDLQIVTDLRIQKPEASGIDPV
ncbi:MAG: 6-phosphogluconolactonase [Myxococcota bacterium]